MMKMPISATPACRVPILSASSALIPLAGWSWTSSSSGAWITIRATQTTAIAPRRPMTAPPHSSAEKESITGRVKTKKP